MAVELGFPERKWLIEATSAAEMVVEDTWVNVVPPSWRTTKIRDQYLEGTNVYGAPSLTALEIYLCYGGTNLAILVPQLLPNGDPISEDGDWILVDEIEFDDTGALDAETFFERLAMLPTELVEKWHALTLESAPEWIN